MALDSATQEFIMEEITRQLKPVGTQLDAVMAANDATKKQVDDLLVINKEQSTSLGTVVKWMHEFWGNGSGRTGYYERRVKQDDERYESLMAFRDELQIDKYKKEGAAEVLKEIAATNKATMANTTERGKATREWLLIGATAAPFIIIELVKIVFHK